jgi:hypothetical protein
MTKRSKPKLFNKEYQKQWSEEYKYKHIHTGEHCTFEAYVAEYLVIRWTDAFKMDKPSYKFWTAGDKYHDFFMRNMKALNSLKKKFEEKIIIEAIKSKYFEKIYHIGLKAYGPRGWKYNQVALKAIEQYNKEVKQSEKLSKESKKDIPIIEEKKQELVRRKIPANKNKSMINKLRNI